MGSFWRIGAETPSAWATHRRATGVAVAYFAHLAQSSLEKRNSMIKNQSKQKNDWEVRRSTISGWWCFLVFDVLCCGILWCGCLLFVAGRSWGPWQAPRVRTLWNISFSFNHDLLIQKVGFLEPHIPIARWFVSAFVTTLFDKTFLSPIHAAGPSYSHFSEIYTPCGL